MRGAPSGQASVAILSSAGSGGSGIAARRLAAALADHTDLGVDFIDRTALGETLPADVVSPESFTNGTISDVHFTVEHPGYVRGWLVRMLSAYDVVNVHWAVTLIGLGELVAIAETGTTLVLTLHDFQPVSGGCHYPGLCTRLPYGCHACPQIDRSRASLTVPPRNRRLKAGLFARPNVHLVAPSHYVVDRAVASGVAPAERASVLRNPYEPLSAPQPRQAGEPVRVLLIADHLGERRKNMQLALESIGRWRAAGRSDILVDLVGDGGIAVMRHLEAADVPFQLHGRLDSHPALTKVLMKADVMFTASNDDNWPNVLVEAGAYGAVPVVGPGHGCAEFVETYGVGAVADSYEADDFADALEAAAATPTAARRTLASRVREDHAPEAIAAAFRAWFAALTLPPEVSSV